MSRRGRKSSVRYYASMNGYFTHSEGKSIRLADGPDDAPKGKTYLAALARFQELMQFSDADTANRGNALRVVVENTSQHGMAVPGNTLGSTVFCDPVNKVSVVTDMVSGRVVTVRQGPS